MRELNKKYESPLATPFYHSVHYIQFSYTLVNEFFRWTRTGEVGHCRDKQIDTEE